MTNVIIDSVRYLLSGTDATVMGYNGTTPADTNLEIPSIITYLDNSYNVTSIYEFSFFTNANLTSLTIGNKITSIGSHAFYGCTSLTSIIIPNSVNIIDTNAFNGCTSLTTIVINSYINNLSSAFGNLNNANASWTFDYSGAIPNGICNQRNGVTSVTIGSSITSIGDSAFAGCVDLSNILLPSLITSIENNAFQYCSGLTSIELPISLVNIGNSVFQGCTGLTNIVINSNLSNLVNAFNGVNNDNMSWTFDYSGNIPNNICNNRKVINLTIGNSITGIGDAAFAGCVDLSNITLPPSLKNIGYTAFASSGITSVTIPATVETIGDYAFGGCNSLRYIDTKAYLPNLGIIFFGTNPDNSTFIFDYSGAIPDGSCWMKTGLRDIYIGDYITGIGKESFGNCQGLTNIFISPSVTSIDDEAFVDCTNLLNIPFPKNINYLGNNIFRQRFSSSSPTARFIPSASFSLSPQILSDGSYTIIDPVKPLNSTSNWIYSSSNTNVATINGNVITFIRSGLTIISATLPRDNLYTEITLTYPLSISETNEVSTFIYTDPNVINSIVLNTRPDAENDTIVTISAEALTPETLAITNPPDGTEEEKLLNRDNVVSNLFVGDTVIQEVVVPIDMIFITPEIDTSNATSLTILNTVETTQENPKVVETTTISESDIVFCLLENPGNTVSYAGFGEFTDYFFIVTKNANSTFTVIKTNSLDAPIISIANKGDIFYYAGFKYVIGSLTAQISTEPPIVPICFLAGSLVKTDQGLIEIQKINVKKNTIRGKKIVAITKTMTIEDKIVCIEKDALGKSVPSQKTLISRNHKLLYNKQMIKAKHLIGQIDGVYNKKYNGEVLYNILLETYEKMIVNNLIVETLDPNNVIAQLYNGSFNLKEKNNAIININQCANEYKKQYGKLK